MVSGLTGGCASTVHADLPPGVVSVVAATSVWGDVAQQVGGRWVAVTSVISNPSQDPHSFEGSARVLLAVKKADLLIENGGGYDYFMHQMIGAADTTAPVIDAVQVSGHRAPPRGELNEHVWYDIHSAAKVADAVAARLREIEPGHARYFSSQAAAFRHGVARLAAAERRVRQLASGQGVGITEPLPLYLLDAMGLRNLTPPEFSRAVEDGGEVAARVLAETLDLYSQHRVVALVYNSQTSSPVTEQVEDAARSAGVAVVPVTETMPAGDTYLTWMRRNIAAVARAVSTQ
jgi:zinc/manganese transport system substrate-binding protein